MAGYKDGAFAPYKADGLIEITVNEAIIMPVKIDVSVADGTTLLRGTVLGKLTATGAYVVYDSTAADGSEVIANTVVLMQDFEKLGADDQTSVIYEADSIDHSLLVFTTGADRTAWEAAAPERLRQVSANLALV